MVSIVQIGQGGVGLHRRRQRGDGAGHRDPDLHPSEAVHNCRHRAHCTRHCGGIGGGQDTGKALVEEQPHERSNIDLTSKLTLTTQPCCYPLLLYWDDYFLRHSTIQFYQF